MWKGFALGFWLVVLFLKPIDLVAWKFLAFFGILRSVTDPWTEPLTEHNNWNYTFCGCCDSFWGRVLYQVCFPLVFFVLGLTLLEICLRSLSRVLTLFFLDLLLYYSMIWLHRSTAVVYDLKLAHHIDLLLFELKFKALQVDLLSSDLNVSAI